MMLSLKAFHPSYDKVRQVEFHPVLPWLVSTTKSDHVCVWDYAKQQVVMEMQLGVVGEEELSADADLARVHAKDPVVTVNASLAPHTTSRSPTGRLRDVRFLDADVAGAQLSATHLLASGTGLPCPTSAPITALRGQRLLVVVGESKVLVVDLVGRRVREVPKALLEGKTPTCVAFLFQGGASASARDSHVMPSPVLALGCADGMVRLIALSTLRPVARLVSPHKSAIACLSVQGVRGVQWEGLVAGFTGGSVTMWEPFSKPLPVGGAPGGMVLPDVSPKADADRAHDKEVVGMVGCAVMEDPETAPGRMVMTCGVDCRLLGLDPVDLKEGLKLKLDPKAPPTCLAYAPRGFMASGAHCVLVGTEVGLILAVHPPSGSIKPAAHLATLTPSGAKRSPKIYGLAVHPYQPQLVAAATNTGTALLRLDAMPPLPAAPLPLRSPAQALGTGASRGGGSGVTYVVALGPSVVCASAAVVESPEAVTPAQPPAVPPKPKDPTPLLELLDDSPAPAPGPARPLPAAPARTPGNKPTIVQVLGTMKLGAGKPSVRAVLGASADGSYVSAVWPVARHYAIYRQSATAWEEVASGSGVSVAWHASEPMFAVAIDGGVPLLLSAGAEAGTKDKKEKKKDKKKDKKAAEAEAAAKAAALAAAPAACVQVWEISARGVALRHKLPASLGEGAARLYSGPLLGVALNKTLASAAGVTGSTEAPPALQLVDWVGGAKVGPELPEPQVVAWEPGGRCVALAYHGQVVICAQRPALTPLAVLPLAGVCGMEWAQRQLYLLTTTGIHLAVVSLPPDATPTGPGPNALGGGLNMDMLLGAANMAAPTTLTTATGMHVMLVELAALGAPPAGSGGSSGFGSGGAGVQSTDTVVAAASGPGGSGCALLPPTQPRPPGPLVLLGPRDGCLWVVNAHGQPVAVPLMQHAGLRAVCVAATGDAGAAAKLAASEVAPQHHDQLAALLCGLDGTRGASAALASLTGISLAAEMRLRLALHNWPQAMECVEALLSGYTQRPPRTQFSYPVTAAAFGGVPGSGAANPLAFLGPASSAAGKAHPEDLDWLQPLRGAAPSTATRASAAAAAGAPPPPSGTASPLALDLGLSLLEALLPTGQLDVARHLINLLCARAGAMGPQQASRLAAAMAEAGMRQELPRLAAQLAGGTHGATGDAAALLASLLSGHTSLANDALLQAHEPGLAAAHAAAFGVSGGVAAAQWGHQLAAAAVGMAPAGLAADAVSMFVASSGPVAAA